MLDLGWYRLVKKVEGVFVKRFIQIVLLMSLSGAANAVDYYNVQVTGIGISEATDNVRFTIDKDPAVIFTTQSFQGESLKRLVALLYAAYTAQSPIYFIRSGEATSSTTPHYTNVSFISVGARTWD